MLEESLQVGISFLEVVKDIKNFQNILGTDFFKEDEWTTMSIIQTCLNNGNFVKLLQSIASIPKLKDFYQERSFFFESDQIEFLASLFIQLESLKFNIEIEEVKKKKKKKKVKTEDEGDGISKSKKIVKKKTIREISDPDAQNDVLDESPDKPTSLLKQIKSGSKSESVQLSGSYRMEPSFIPEKIEKKEIKEKESVPLGMSLQPTSFLDNEPPKSLIGQELEKTDKKGSILQEIRKKSEIGPVFGSFRENTHLGDDSLMSKSFSQHSLPRSNSIMGSHERKKEFDERKRQIELKKKELEEKRKTAQVGSSPIKEQHMPEVKPKRETQRKLFDDTPVVENAPIEVKEEEEAPSEPIHIDKLKQEKITITLPDEPFVPLKPASPKMVQFNPIIDPVDEEEQTSPKVKFSTVVTLIDNQKNPEFKDEEVDKILSEATPIKKRTEKKFFESCQNVQKEAIGVANTLIHNLLHNRQFETNLDPDLELMMARLQNIKERSWFLKTKKNPTTFPPLEIESARGYEGSHDNLIKTAILSEKIKYREERLKIAEKLFELEFKHESESRKLVSNLKTTLSVRQEPKPHIPEIHIAPVEKKQSPVRRDPVKSDTLRFDTPIKSKDVMPREDVKLQLHVDNESDEFDLISYDNVSESEKTPRKQVAPKHEEQHGVPSSPLMQSGRHMKLYIEMPQAIPKAKQLELQNNQCSGCSIVLKEGFFSRLRFCFYTNKYYCNDCHKNDTSYIPAFIIHNWDFKQNYVCNMAKNYLESIFNIPMICVSAINPGLFDKVPNLMKARMLRKRLMIQWDIMNDCPSKEAVVEKLKLESYMNYLTNTEIYSIQNLDQLNQNAQNSPFLKRLSKIFAVLSEHITSQCKYCRKKAGVICSVCYDTNPIYAFNLSTVNQCSNCNLIYHRACFKNKNGETGCPNCN